MIVFRLDVEGEADGIIVAYVEQLGSFLQDIGEHQDHEVIAALGAELIHVSDELVFSVEHLERVDADDLCNTKRMLGDVEFLKVGLHEFLDGLGVEGSIEEVVPQFVDRNTGDTCETLSHRDISLCAGRGLEHNGIGKDRGAHQAGHFRRRHDTVLLVEFRDDRIRRSDRLVTHRDRLCGLDIRESVVVDDTQDLRLLEARNGLCELVMVHQYDLLSSRTEKVESSESSDDLVVFVKDRITSETALQDDFLNIVDVVVEVKALDLAGVAGSRDRERLVDKLGGLAGIKRRGDHACVCLPGEPVRVNIGLAEDEAVNADLEGPLDHIRLVAAENDTVFGREQEVLVGLRKCDADFAGDGIRGGIAFVDDTSFQNAQEVKERKVVDVRIVDRLHVVGGDIAGRECTVKRAVLVDNGNDGDLALGHRSPGFVQSDLGIQRRRCIEVQILYLRPYITDTKRCLKSESLEHTLGFIA